MSIKERHSCGHEEIITHPESFYDLDFRRNFIRSTPCKACKRKEQDAISEAWEQGRNLPHLHACLEDEDTISFGRICRKQSFELLHQISTNPDLLREIFRRVHIDTFDAHLAEHYAIQYLSRITDARWFIEKGSYTEYILQDSYSDAILQEVLKIS